MIDPVDPRRAPPVYLDLLTNEEREVIVAKFWQKVPVSAQAGDDPAKLVRLRAAYRSAIKKLRELLT